MFSLSLGAASKSAFLPWTSYVIGSKEDYRRSPPLGIQEACSWHCSKNNCPLLFHLHCKLDAFPTAKTTSFHECRGCYVDTGTFLQSFGWLGYSGRVFIWARVYSWRNAAERGWKKPVESGGEWWRVVEAAAASAGQKDTARQPEVLRVHSDWWCSNCLQMPTETELFCCTESMHGQFLVDAVTNCKPERACVHYYA